MKKKNLIIIMLCFILSNQAEPKSFGWWMWTVVGVVMIITDLFGIKTKQRREEE